MASADNDESESNGDTDALSDKTKTTRAKDRHGAELSASRLMTDAISKHSEETKVLEAIHNAAVKIVREAGEDMSDRADAIEGALHAAIREAPKAGVSKQKAAESAAAGALEGAGYVSDTAVEHTKQIITQRIDGVEPLDEAIFTDGRSP